MEFSCSCKIKLDPQITAFYVCKESVLTNELTGHNVGFMPHCFIVLWLILCSVVWVYSYVTLLGFVVKQN